MTTQYWVQFDFTIVTAATGDAGSVLSLFGQPLTANTNIELAGDAEIWNGNMSSPYSLPYVAYYSSLDSSGLNSALAYAAYYPAPLDPLYINEETTIGDVYVKGSALDPSTLTGPVSSETFDNVWPNTYQYTVYWNVYVWALVTLEGTGGLTIADKSETAGITISYNSSFNEIAVLQTGSIAFTDSDPNATTSASITDQTASATIGGYQVNLTPSQVTALKAAFTIPAGPGNTTNSAVNWTYNPSALNFVAPGETANVISTVQIADSDGNSDQATVTVTLKGPSLPANIEAGFDSQYMPSNMAAIKASTNLSAVGFYLPSAVNYNAKGAPPGGTWEGNLSTLQQQGWLVQPIWVGYQAIGALSANGTPLANVPSGQATLVGISDAVQAAIDMQMAAGQNQQGFVSGAVCYLDDRFHEIDHGTSGLFADSSFAIG